MKTLSGTLAAICFVLMLSCACLPAPANAAQQERILSFDSRIEVQPDASVSVLETIRVVCGGDKIRRGIFRKVITTYHSTLGLQSRRTLRVLKVQRNGAPDDYHLKSQGDSTSIYIGNKNVLLKPGVYTYTIRYTLNDMVGFFKDHDELYWNVTGNNWDFPIDAVRATVLLPSGARITGHKSFTGERGSTSSTATEHTGAANEITFQNSRPVLPGEGLTIVVTWPKGVVAEPDVSTRVAQQLEANISSLIALLGVLCVLGYFFLAWLLVGRDPAKQTIVPLFAPPKGFSPAAARMVMHMGFDTTCFTAAILSMAVKGFLRIEEQDKTYTLIKTGQSQDRLSHGEKSAAQALFPHGNSLTLKQSQHERIKSGVDTLKNSLKTEYGKAYFRTNRFFFLIGVLLTFLTLVFVVLALPDADSQASAAFLTVWLTFWSFGCAMLVGNVVKAIRHKTIAAAIFSGLFALPFLAGEAAGLFFLATAAGPVNVALMLVLWALLPWFYHLLKAPTYAGRRIMDEIEGFKMFLSIGEKERLNLLHPPDRTPELWERFLPYAVALDVENQWAEQFTSVLDSAAVSDAGYSPAWYTGSSLAGGFYAGTFASSLGSSLTSAVSSSSATPSSSSGMSGGSSGGGGGGGGGGGW